MADVVTDDLRVRSEPRVSEDSALLEPLLATGDRVFIVQGPVRANDYDWYEVVPERPVIDNIAEELPTGWVAAADHDGTPWLQAAPPECPPLPVTLGQLLDLTAKARLACYGSRELTMEGVFLEAVTGYVSEPCLETLPTRCDYSPRWLFVDAGMPVSPPDETGASRWLSVIQDPERHLGDIPVDGALLRITGSFDHPAARGCRYWDPSADLDLTPRAQAVVECRAHFVASSMDVISQPVLPTEPDPSVAVLVNDDRITVRWPVGSGGTVDVEVALVVRDLAIADCALLHVITPDDPAVEGSVEPLQPLATQTVSLIDGWHDFRASCESSLGTLEAQTSALGADDQPERCRDFDFSEGPVSVTTFQELAEGVIGTWEGCVDSPWVPDYFVTMVFRDDGTYSSESAEELDGQEMIALYYGTDEESPAKRFAINDLQDNLTGLGQIDIVHSVDPTVTPGRGEMRDIRLMGDQLEFEFFYRGYGPLVFRLFRTT
jgi:hypothetical protein